MKTAHTSLPVPEELSQQKFIRRPDLSAFVRVQIAFTALFAQHQRQWGIMSQLARQHFISLTFVYMLAATLEQTAQSVFGEVRRPAVVSDTSYAYRHMLSSYSTLNTAMRQKTLTVSEDTPIISREALLSLVEWVRIRRQKHERSTSENSGDELESSGALQTTHHCSVSSDDRPSSGRQTQQEGAPDEEGS